MTGDYDSIIGMQKEEPLHRFTTGIPSGGSSRPSVSPLFPASRRKPTTPPGWRCGSAGGAGGRLEPARPGFWLR